MIHHDRITQTRAGMMMSAWPTRTFSRSPLLWLNFVCLDPPLVAVCWQWLFGQSFHLPIPMGNRIALCLTAWLIYLADRFSDSIALRSNQQKSQRQQFCLQYRNIWLCAIGCVAVVDAGDRAEPDIAVLQTKL